jgi:hypothetical protein
MSTTFWFVLTTLAMVIGPYLIVALYLAWRWGNP